jgi:selenocysteine-specific elongation factor
VLFDSEPPHALSRAAADGLLRAARGALERFHAEQPLKPAMPLPELRRRAFRALPPAVADRLLAELAAGGTLRLLPDAAALAGHEVRFSAEEERARAWLVDASLRAGLAGIDAAAAAAAAGLDPGTVERVTRALQGEGVLARIGSGTLVHREHLDRLKAEVRRLVPRGQKLDVAVVKEVTGLTRKHVIPLLEYLDRERVTRRSGSERFVVG